VGIQIDSPDGIGPTVLPRLAGEIANRSSAGTANKVLRHLFSLLRYASELKVLCGEVPPSFKLKEPQRLPEAWTTDEVQLILAEAIREPGMIDDVPGNRWWYSLLLTLYYCGGRIGAVRKTVPLDFLIEQRAIILRASNQKQVADQYLHLPDQCIAAVAAIYDSRRKRLWPWPFHRTTLYCRFRGLLRRAGVRYGQGRGGLFHKLRRTHASYMAANGGDASYSLGHSSAAEHTTSIRASWVGDKSIVCHACVWTPSATSRRADRRRGLSECFVSFLRARSRESGAGLFHASYLKGRPKWLRPWCRGRSDCGRWKTVSARISSRSCRPAWT
jgi:hypothetical protein